MTDGYNYDSSALPALLMAMLDELYNEDREKFIRVKNAYVAYRRQLYRSTYASVDSLIESKLGLDPNEIAYTTGSDYPW